MHSDEHGIVFENGALRVVLLPGSGGRIESLQGEGSSFAPAILSGRQHKRYEELTSG